MYKTIAWSQICFTVISSESVYTVGAHWYQEYRESQHALTCRTASPTQLAICGDWNVLAFTSPGVRIQSNWQARFLIVYICLTTTSKLHKYLNQSPRHPQGIPQRSLGISIHIYSSSLVSLLEDNFWGSETTIIQFIQTEFGSPSLYMDKEAHLL